jgi:hypothetical protein
MTLTEVDGDFAAVVDVNADIKPGPKLAINRQGNTIPFVFQGAGLLLYQDKGNFIRLERAAGIALETSATIHRVLIEIVTDGKTAVFLYFPLPEGNTRLVLIRRKERVRCLFGSTGGIALTMSPEYVVDLNPKVRVGLTASNISGELFVGNFDNFGLVTDPAHVEALFGN